MDSEGAVIAAARDKLDAEIAALEERIRVLRHERNRLASISRCPPEVMTQIFTWLQQEYLGRFYTGGYFPSDYRKWMVVVRVSQHWREIAMSSRGLWNIIPLKWMTYATESFNRLGEMPMFLVGTDNRWGEENSTLWQNIAAACHRIRSIHGVPTSKLTTFEQPMPLLEYLKITTRCDLSLSFISPSLQTLVLSRCDFSWDWPVLPHLITLEIEMPTQKVALDPFLNILRTSPALKDLRIDGIFPEKSVFRPAEYQPAQPSPHLPVLSSFRACGNPSSLDLLSQFRFSPVFKIDIERIRIAPGSLSSFMQVPNRILLESSMSIHAIHLQRQTGYYNGNHGPIDLMFREKSRDEAPFMRINFSPTGDGDLSSWVKDIALLPLDQMKHFTTDLVTDPIIWGESGLGQLPKLSSLTVNYGGQAFLEHLVKEYAEYKAAKGQTILSFTSLEDLETTGVHISREQKRPLCDMLAGREKAGYRLKRLDLSAAQLTDDAVKQLEKYVDKLDVYLVRKRKTRRGY